MGISIPQLLIILVILLLLFGTKRLRNIGSDLGDAVKGFRKALGGDDDKAESKPVELEKKDADFNFKSSDFKSSDLDDDQKSGVKTPSESAQDKK